MIEYIISMPPRLGGADLTLDDEQVAAIRVQVSMNANTSKRYKRLHQISLRDTAIISLLLLGVKPSEMIELRLDDLVFESLKVRPRRGGDRLISLDKEARRYLTLYIEGVEPDERVLLFVSQRGNMMDVRSIQRSVADLGEQVGLHLVPGRLNRVAKK